MQDRSLLNGTLTALLSPIVEFYHPLRWFLILGVILVLCDLRWGVAKSRRQGEEIRFSRAGRRTINKMVDYLCWVTIGGVLGESFGDVFGIPVIPASIILVVYGIEVNSCFSNYFAARGINKRVNIFSFFKRKLDIIEVEDNDKNKQDHDTTRV